jgi:aryl-alcohol dehydrogenase-like predicted oxidoreductase
LGQGALTGRYNYRNRPKDAARSTNRLFTEGNTREIEKVLTVLSAIGKQHDKTVAQVALNWLMRDPIVIPIPGASNPKQAEENAGAAGWRLRDGELKEIEHVLDKLKIEYYP